MDILETIGEVFAYNLRRYRAKRTQSEIAEAVNLSLRGYQRLEDGTLPRSAETVAELAKTFSVRETALFLDPDLTEPTDAQVLARVIAKFGESSAKSPLLQQAGGLLSEISEDDLPGVIGFLKMTVAQNEAIRSGFLENPGTVKKGKVSK